MFVRSHEGGRSSSREAPAAIHFAARRRNRIATVMTVIRTFEIATTNAAFVDPRKIQSRDDHSPSRRAKAGIARSNGEPRRPRTMGQRPAPDPRAPGPRGAVLGRAVAAP